MYFIDGPETILSAQHEIAVIYGLYFFSGKHLKCHSVKKDRVLLLRPRISSGILQYRCSCILNEETTPKGGLKHRIPFNTRAQYG